MEKVFENGKAVYYSKFRAHVTDHLGKQKTIVLLENKRESERQATKLQSRYDDMRNGLIAPPTASSKAGRRDFADVVAEYLEWGNTNGGRKNNPWSPDYAGKRVFYLNWWKNVLNLKLLVDLYGRLADAEKAVRRLKIQNTGKAPTGKTRNAYIEALVTFCNWVKKRNYLENNPFEGITQYNSNVVNVRRALEGNDIKKLLNSCSRSMSIMYETAFLTGFRRRELRSLDLTSIHIDPDKDIQEIELAEGVDKGRVERQQRMPLEFLKRLIEYGKSGEAKLLYQKAYKRGGQTCVTDADVPENPLLYVPTTAF